MRAEHFEFLVEEPSMEAFLAALLPRLLGDRATYAIHAHQGKDDLLGKLGSRLRGYAKWLPKAARIVVLVDRDDDDCMILKKKIDADAVAAGLQTRSAAGRAVWQIVNRIAIEELEAWYFSEWSSVKSAFPRVSDSIPKKASYRKPDEIAGGTWEAFERVMRGAGYFATGLRKMEAAEAVGRLFDWNASISPSFSYFRNSLLEAIEQA